MNDLKKIIDELENQIKSAKKKPFSDDVFVSREQMLNLIYQLREVTPEVVKNAEYVVQNRNKILDEAEAEGTKFVEDAKRQAKNMVLDSKIMQQAEIEAEKLVSEAQEYKNQVEYEIKMRIDKLLADSEQTLSDSINLIRNNREEIRGSLLKYDEKR